jgi:hypothetical protein
MFWFITCIFGIKTKSAPKKIISITRTYLNYIREMRLLNPPLLVNPILGCNITFPLVANPVPAAVELLGEDGGLVAVPQILGNYDNVLCLAYDPYTIEKAFTLYKNAERNFRADPENYVFKIENTIAIRKDSEVLKRDVLSRLTDAFSKLPRGQAYLNESYNFMNTTLTNFIIALGGDRSIFNILSRIAGIHGILINNPYKPTPHDVSKFIDYRKSPQAYRNDWINYLLTQIFNSADDGEKLFNHMKLLVLLFKYLILLPTYLETDEVVVQPVTETTQNALAFARQLIQRHYNCAQITVRQAAQTEGLLSQGIIQNIQAAQGTTQQRNAADAADVAAAAAAAVPARGRRAVAQPLPAPVDEQPVRGTRRRRTVTLPDTLENTKKGRQGGGTIRIRNPRSPKKPNNHTRRNKYKRNNKNKKHKSSPKYRKINPSSRSGSQSNRKKSKSKLPQKNVTFKRRMYNK